jgi:hypothetical protein
MVQISNMDNIIIFDLTANIQLKHNTVLIDVMNIILKPNGILTYIIKPVIQHKKIIKII